ncbi:S-layer homology domain-containing protein [Veillonella parvula]|uniref:S-layer homology domain-containing protein n=1 Tax=Veillonella parvula TaxID=29466 RepID=UPI001602EC48|nr:S-layer homology domain-containing protein [Veillonella parvula]
MKHRKIPLFLAVVIAISSGNYISNAVTVTGTDDVVTTGKTAELNDSHSNVLGIQSITTNGGGIAIGEASTIQDSRVVTSDDGYIIGTSPNTVIGSGSVAKTLSGSMNSALVLGSNSLVNAATGGIAVGSLVTVGPTANNSIAMGNYSHTTGSESLSIGAFSNGTYTINSDGSVSSTAKSNGDESTAVGFNTSTAGNKSTALGSQAAADGERAVSIGTNSAASNISSIALGDTAHSTNRNAVAIGTTSVAKGESSIALGNTTKALAKNSIALGNATEASAEGTSALGNAAHAIGSQSTALGDASNAKGVQSLAGGYNAQALGDNSVSLGNASKAEAVDTTAVGNTALASGKSSSAYGNNSKALGDSSVAVGNSAKTSGSNAITVGTDSNVHGNQSGTIGYQNTVTQDNTYAIGNNIMTTQANSVILGSASTDRTATTETQANINGINYSGFAGVGSARNGVTSVGASGKERQVINVASGKVSSDSTDAINGSQLYAVANTVGNVANSTKNILGGNAAVGTDGTITMSNIGGTGASTVHDAIKAAYDKDSSVKAGSSNITVTNANQNATGGTEYTVDIARNLSLDSVTTGNTVINNKGVSIGGTTYVSDNGLNANFKKITNVADGEVSATSKDAVNGSQLYQATSGISNGVNLLNSKIGKVGAGAAALAAIHPLDFDPDDKWNFAAGYGNYAGENAMALGAFYRPNEDTMFSVAGSMGNGENMVNAGVSLKLGQKNGVSTSRVALAKEVQDLKAIVKAQNVEIQQMKASMGMAPQYDKKDVNFPDVPANHWAYEYVKDLADKGLVEGYPDGEFKGDRAMTRYEYAAIIYRALQLGAPIDGKMGRAINEFNPELARLRDLDRTRVDRISGKDNDRHKVERLRVNNKDNKQTNDYRDVYGSHIERNAK